MGLFGDSTNFMSDTSIYAGVVALLANAHRRLTIVSPYVDIPTSLQRQIEDKVSGKDRISLDFYFREDKLPEYGKAAWFASLNTAGVRFFAVEHLHAKLYVSEASAILTSMNLVSFSKDNSHEVGVQVAQDTSLYRDIDAYIEKLKRHAKPVVPGAVSVVHPSTARHAVEAPTRASSDRTSRAPAKSRKRQRDPDAGSCIACSDEVEFNPERPYCRSCYKEEADGVFCHACGEPGTTSIEKPLCYPCFKLQQ